jgi:uncharacterized membrane protein
VVDLFNTTEALLGSLTSLVNNAGIYSFLLGAGCLAGKGLDFF